VACVWVAVTAARPPLCARFERLPAHLAVFVQCGFEHWHLEARVHYLEAVFAAGLADGRFGSARRSLHCRHGQQDSQ
jgi:hypothetical protein